MNNMCCAEDNLKAGLKLALGTLIKQCCAILIDQYATSCQRSVADQIREFKDVFSSPTHCAKLMATAEYKLKEKRQQQNHKPCHSPDEDDLAKLMAFVDEALTSTTDITSTGAFVQARKVALAHVTLLNARCGSEAVRLLPSDWKDRHSWIDHSQLSSTDKELLSQYSVAPCHGQRRPAASRLLPGKMRGRVGDVGRQRRPTASWCVHIEQVPVRLHRRFV